MNWPSVTPRRPKKLDTLGVWNGRSLAVHAVWVDDADMAILKQRGVGIAHCPSSNMKLASGSRRLRACWNSVFPSVWAPMVRLAATTTSNLFEEMDLAAKLAKVTIGNPQAVPARDALDMATIRGAPALGLEKEISSLEPGKRANMIMVRLDLPNAQPLYDAVSQMFYTLIGGDVRDVMVTASR